MATAFRMWRRAARTLVERERGEEDADSAQGIGRAPVAASNTDDESIEFADDEHTLFFRIGHRVLTTRKLTGQFPNYEAVMPRDNNKFVVVRSEDLMGSIQRVAQFADERSGAIKIRLEQNELKISSSSTDAGESEDTIETPYNFDPIVVGFNSAYLIDFLKAVGSAGEVRLEFKDAQSAGQMRPEDAGENTSIATSSCRCGSEGASLRCQYEEAYPLFAVMMTWILLGISSAQPAPKAPISEVRRPSIVAFFPPVSAAELKDGETNESLSDFQFYAGRVQPPLMNAGIDFHEIYSHSFSIRLGTTTTTFHPKKVDVGYYFVAPGKKPHIEYGVMTDADLLLVADRYFGLTGNRD